MKKYFIFSLVSMMLIGFSSYAQEVSKDSISVLKQEKKDLEVSQRINDNKLKLAKLENMVKEKTETESSSAVDAQKAATDNHETAVQLSNDPQDKKLARKARKDARHAQRMAKAGRNASSDLKDLEDEIKSLKKKIAKDEDKAGIVAKY